jgi:hypothetical protein
MLLRLHLCFSKMYVKSYWRAKNVCGHKYILKSFLQLRWGRDTQAEILRHQGESWYRGHIQWNGTRGLAIIIPLDLTSGSGFATACHRSTYQYSHSQNKKQIQKKCAVNKEFKSGLYVLPSQRIPPTRRKICAYHSSLELSLFLTKDGFETIRLQQ